MTLLIPIVWLILAVTTAEVQHRVQPPLQTTSNPTRTRRTGEAIIENNNVNENLNIIVNVNPQEVANELWKVIETHLDRTGRSSLNRRFFVRRTQETTTRALEKVLKSLVSSTRRNAPSADDLAFYFEEIVRKAIRNKIDPSVDSEELVRIIVDDMMLTMNRFRTPTDMQEAQMGARKFGVDNTEDDLLSIRVKIYKEDILRAFE